jgi:peroxiredoxin
MLQAEIAGRFAVTHEGFPAQGDVIRDFEFLSADGHPVLLSEVRGRSNMVLVLAGESDLAHNLLSELGRHQSALNGDETRALAVVAGSWKRACELKRVLNLDFEVVADKDALVHLSLGTRDRTGHILPAVIITDRFGEVFAGFRASQGKPLPNFEEIVGWIDFIDRLCPECGPREWPD